MLRFHTLRGGSASGAVLRSSSAHTLAAASCNARAVPAPASARTAFCWAAASLAHSVSPLQLNSCVAPCRSFATGRSFRPKRRPTTYDPPQDFEEVDDPAARFSAPAEADLPPAIVAALRAQEAEAAAGSEQPDDDDASADDAGLWAAISKRKHELPKVVADRNFLLGNKASRSDSSSGSSAPTAQEREHARMVSEAASHPELAFTQRSTDDALADLDLGGDGDSSMTAAPMAVKYRRTRVREQREREAAMAAREQEERKREREFHAQQQQAQLRAERTPAPPRQADGYTAYRPYDTRGSPATQQPRYTSSRASPAQIAWRTHLQRQQEQNAATGHDQDSNIADAAPFPTQVNESAGMMQSDAPSDATEEVASRSRFELNSAKDAAARAKYAARHKLGAASRAVPAAASLASANATQSYTSTLKAPHSATAAQPTDNDTLRQTEALRSQIDDSSTSAAPQAFSQQSSQPPQQTSLQPPVEEENWSIPQPSDWERPIPPERPGSKYSKYSRMDEDDSGGWKGFGDARRDRGAVRGRDGDFATQRDTDGFRERIGYAPRDVREVRGSSKGKRSFESAYPRRGDAWNQISEGMKQETKDVEEIEEEVSAKQDSASTSNAAGTWQEPWAVTPAEAAAAAAASPIAPRRAPRDPPVRHPDGLRGATAAERYAATNSASLGYQPRDRNAKPTPWSKLRDEKKLSVGGYDVHGDLLYGVHPVLCALQAQRRRAFYRLFLQDNKAARLSGRLAGQPPTDIEAQERIVSLARARGVPIVYLPKHELNLLSENRPHNGFALDAAPLSPPMLYSAYDLDASLRSVRLARMSTPSASTPSSRVWVLLDEIMDPQNLGAMLRSCLYFDVAGVIVCAKNSATLGGTTSKASSGAQEFLHIVYADSTPRLLHKLDERQWNIVGLSLAPDSVDMRRLAERLSTLRQDDSDANEAGRKARTERTGDASSAKYTLLVVGNEGRGLRPVVTAACHVLAKIVGVGSALPLNLTSAGSSGDAATPPSLALDSSAPEHDQRRSAELAVEADRVNSEEEAEFASSTRRRTSSPPSASSTPAGDVSPSQRFVDSLNVSNALAVALYELSR